MSTINQFSVSFQCAAGHGEFDWGEKSVRILRWSQFFCACAQFFPLSIHRHLWLVHVYILKTCCYAIPLVFIEKIFMNYFICLITFRSSTQFDYMPQYFECFTFCTEPRKKIHFHANFRMILMITGFRIVFPLLLIPQCWYFFFPIENGNYYHPFNFVLNINGLFFGLSENSGWRVWAV